MDYVSCSSRAVVRQRIGSFIPEEKHSSFFPETEKARVSDAVYAELASGIQSGRAPSDQPLLYELDVLGSFFCYRYAVRRLS